MDQKLKLRVALASGIESVAYPYAGSDSDWIYTALTAAI